MINVPEPDWENKDKPRLILTVQSLAPVGLPFKEAVTEGITVSDHYDNVTSVGSQARLIAAIGGWYSAAVGVMAKVIRKEEGEKSSEAFMKDMKQMTEDMANTGVYRIKDDDE